MKLTTRDWDFLEREIRFTAVRSRGPGGQNVNKVASSAVLHWDFRNSPHLNDDEKLLIEFKLDAHLSRDCELQIRSDSFRDLERNKDECLKRLIILLERAFFKPKPRKKTKPTRASKVKRRESKMRRGEVKKGRGKTKIYQTR